MFKKLQLSLKISWKKMGLYQYKAKICKQKCLRYRKTFMYLSWVNYFITKLIMMISIHMRSIWVFYFKCKYCFSWTREISYLGPFIWQLILIQRFKHCQCFLKQLLGNESQRTAHAGYVKCILEILALFNPLNASVALI